MHRAMWLLSFIAVCVASFGASAQGLTLFTTPLNNLNMPPQEYGINADKTTVDVKSGSWLIVGAKKITDNTFQQLSFEAIGANGSVLRQNVVQKSSSDVTGTLPQSCGTSRKRCFPTNIVVSTGTGAITLKATTLQLGQIVEAVTVTLNPLDSTCTGAAPPTIPAFVKLTFDNTVSKVTSAGFTITYKYDGANPLAPTEPVCTNTPGIVTVVGPFAVSGSAKDQYLPPTMMAVNVGTLPAVGMWLITATLNTPANTVIRCRLAASAINKTLGVFLRDSDPFSNNLTTGPPGGNCAA